MCGNPAVCGWHRHIYNLYSLFTFRIRPDFTDRKKGAVTKTEILNCSWQRHGMALFLSVHSRQKRAAPVEVCAFCPQENGRLRRRALVVCTRACLTVFSTSVADSWRRSAFITIFLNLRAANGLTLYSLGIVLRYV